MTTPAFGAYVNRIRACFAAKGGMDL
jgi:hypothetical protein